MAWDDLKMDTIIARMLRIGVLTSAAVVFAGGVLYLFNSHGPHPDYTHFHGEPASLLNPGAILAGLMHADARHIIQFGLLLLILTPIARVFLCIVGFATQRDRLYVAVSSIVLTVLLYSLIHSH
jgi:uncharacterized membrane protein